MKRRVLALTTVGVVGALALTACGSSKSGGSSADGTTTIKLVAADYGSNGQNPSKAYWDGVVSAFEQANPKIKVDVTVISWDDIDAKLATMIQNKQYPDIVQGPGYATWAKAGLLYKASDVLSGTTQSNLVPSLAKAGEQDGTAYGIPFVSSSRAFLINNALWKKAGLPMTGGKAVAPKTWDEVEADAKKLKAAGVQVPLGVPLGKEEAQAESFMWEMNNGGGYLDASGKWAINSQANVQTFQTLKKWVDEGLTEQAPASVNRTDLYKDFASGKVGMLNGHPTQLGDIKAANLDVTWAPLPTAQAGGTSKTLGVGDWISAFKAGGHADQIKAFLNFAYQKDNQVKFDEEYNLLPVTNDAVTQVSADKPELKPFLDALPNALFVPVSIPAWDKVNTEVKNQIGDALKDPQKGLDNLQQVAQTAGQ